MTVRQMFGCVTDAPPPNQADSRGLPTRLLAQGAEKMGQLHGSGAKKSGTMSRKNPVSKWLRCAHPGTHAPRPAPPSRFARLAKGTQSQLNASVVRLLAGLRASCRAHPKGRDYRRASESKLITRKHLGGGGACSSSGIRGAAVAANCQAMCKHLELCLQLPGRLEGRQRRRQQAAADPAADALEAGRASWKVGRRACVSCLNSLPSSLIARANESASDAAKTIIKRQSCSFDCGRASRPTGPGERGQRQI